MSDAAWAVEFEDRVARERSAMIDLLDASRALSGDFFPQGQTQAAVEENFSSRFAQWREAVDAINELAESRLTRD